MKIDINIDSKQLLASLQTLRLEFPEAAFNIAKEFGNEAVKKGVGGIIPKRTGDLRSTARIESDEGSRSVKFVTGGKSGKATGRTVEYARYVNDGTSKQSPQFFMERSVNAASGEFDSLSQKALKSWLDKL